MLTRPLNRSLIGLVLLIHLRLGFLDLVQQWALRDQDFFKVRFLDFPTSLFFDRSSETGKCDECTHNFSIELLED
jgi:hypothetical protein